MVLAAYRHDTFTVVPVESYTRHEFRVAHEDPRLHSIPHRVPVYHELPEIIADREQLLVFRKFDCVHMRAISARREDVVDVPAELGRVVAPQHVFGVRCAGTLVPNLQLTLVGLAESAEEQEFVGAAHRSNIISVFGPINAGNVAAVAEKPPL